MIIIVSVPTSQIKEEIDRLCNKLDNCISQCTSKEIMFTMGELNAKIRKGTNSEIFGNYRFRSCNKHGEIWVHWYRANDQNSFKNTPDGN